MSYYLNKIRIFILLAFLPAGILYVFLPNLSIKKLTITYPCNDTLFPPEIAPPVFQWDDDISGADLWLITIKFNDRQKVDRGGSRTARTHITNWTPERETWETIKGRSLEKPATVTIRGVKSSLAGKILSRFKPLSKDSITITTSADSVGAPIFYRDVPLPFDFAREKMETIQWRLGDISSSERPPVVLENLPVCGNCHSFTPDGSTLAMDVDSGGDKGSYVITPVEEHVFLTREKLITWSDYKRGEGAVTFGLLAQISPSGRYVATTLEDRVIFFGKSNDITFSQLFFPVKGIIGFYDRKLKKILPLPGADNPDFVQSNPSWSPDGKYIIFARAPIDDFIKNDRTGNIVLTRRQSAIVLGGEEYLEDTANAATYTFSLYRIPFNDGKGGKPEPVPGASHNGKSNYFAKYSPDGKWIVFCKARSFMLLQPDSKLYIMPADFSEEPREMKYNTALMNSWHSWSPNSRWLVFSSKVNSAYTELFLKHIDDKGCGSPPVLLSSFSSNERARNIPEFVNIRQGGIEQIFESFVDYYSYTRKADKLGQYGKFEEAEKSYRTSIKLNPGFAYAHLQLGYLLTRMNRIDEAEREFETAAKLAPEDPAAHELLGTVYLNSEKYDEAQRSFEFSLKLDSNYAPAYLGLGIILQLKGDNGNAQKKFEAALKNDPELADAYYRLGTIFKEKKDYDKAVKAFETFLKYNYDSIYESDTHSSLGTIYLLKREYGKAEKEFETALRIDPGNAGALHNLGLIYMNRKEFGKAEITFRAVLKMNSDITDAFYNLGIIYMNTNEPEKAEKAFQAYYNGLRTTDNGEILNQK